MIKPPLNDAESKWLFANQKRFKKDFFACKLLKIKIKFLKFIKNKTFFKVKISI